MMTVGSLLGHFGMVVDSFGFYLIASRKPSGRVERGESSVKCQSVKWKVWSATCQVGRVLSEVCGVKFELCCRVEILSADHSLKDDQRVGKSLPNLPNPSPARFHSRAAVQNVPVTSQALFRIGISFWWGFHFLYGMHFNRFWMTSWDSFRIYS